MKIKRPFTTIFLSLLLLGLFGGCKPDEPEKDIKVYYSEWLKLPIGKKLDSIHWQYLLDIPQLTQDIIDKGVILMYYNSCCGSAPIYQLPFSSGSVNIYFDVQDIVSTSSWTARILSTRELAFAVDRYRYVILKGGALTGGRKATIDYSDYEAVKKAYNIPD